ncbi:MAG: MATE family efflux transporter [delta proteobacterium ML8_F1]|nr:MAG: MATE family efflux transporter [delta proteobacterium ML8_F1]
MSIRVDLSLEDKRIPDAKAIFTTIWVLAIPAVVDNFFQTVIGFVDTLFVSRIGLAAVSAVGVSNAILAIYFAVFMSLGVAANVLIARSVGAGNLKKAGHIAQQALALAVVLGIVFGVISLLWAEFLLMLMGVEPKVLDTGVIYFQIVAIPSVFISLMFTLSSIQRGTGDTRSPMKVSVLINLMNIVLDYLLIFGFAFIPPLGLRGAAYATVISRMAGSLGLLGYFLNNKQLVLEKTGWCLDKNIQTRLIYLGSPAAAERLVMRVGQVLYFGLIISLGTSTFAAHSIAGNIEIFSYMIGVGFAAAATTLVGQSLGAGNIPLARRYAVMTMAVSAVLMSVVGFFLYLFSSFIGGLFTQDPQVIQQIGIALKVGAFIKPVLAVVLVMTGIHQAAENTRLPMVVTAIGIWLIRTTFVYWLGIELGWGILGINIAIALDNAFRAVALSVSYRRGGWLRYSKVESLENPAVA